MPITLKKNITYVPRRYKSYLIYLYKKTFSIKMQNKNEKNYRSLRTFRLFSKNYLKLLNSKIRFFTISLEDFELFKYNSS